MAKNIIVQPLNNKIVHLTDTIRVAVYGFAGVPVSPGASAFIQLSDVPNSYSGQANKLVAVNNTANGLTFLTLGSGLSIASGVISSSGVLSLVGGTDISITGGNIINNTSTLASATGRGNSTSTGISLTENGNLSGSYALYLKRNTDSSPLGFLIRSQNAAANTDLFTVDVSGNVIGKTLAVTGGASTQFIKADGSLDSNSYITGPGGSNTQLQFNNSGAFGGAGITVSGTGNSNLTLGSTLGGTSRVISVDGSGSNLDLELHSKGSGATILSSDGSGFGVRLYLGTLIDSTTSRSILSQSSSANCDLSLLQQGAGNLYLGSQSSNQSYIKISGGTTSTITNNIFVNIPRNIFLSNALTVPASNPVGGIYTYVESGVWKWRDPSGNIYPLNLNSNLAQGSTNEIQKNGGSGAFSGSGLFSVSSGNITLGSGSITGGSRVITADSSSAASSITLQVKGVANVILNGRNTLIQDETGTYQASIQTFIGGTNITTFGGNLSLSVPNDNNIQFVGNVPGRVNLSLGSATPSFGGGDGVFYIANAFANPSTNPSGGGILYVDSGALKYRGSSGTVTTVAPA